MKICVGLSGGVDSSVAALLLKRQGYDVFAMFMQNWKDSTGTLHGDCEWEEDKYVAELVARKLEIPFYFADLSSEYRQRVVDYMFAEYEKGRTPNPDVLCNREIKFDAFLKLARKMGADMVATGHYCRKDCFTAPDGRTVYRILQGTDPGKDQSYFLCQLDQEQLSRAIFPIGDLLKKEVRELARGAELPSADKKDSQGICFVGKVDLPTFLRQKLKGAVGDVLEVYDAFYGQDHLYLKRKQIISSLLHEGYEGGPPLVSHYVSEDKQSPVEDAHPFDLQKVAALSDEELRILSTPVDYSGISFETETYRSGRRHTLKTRYKENPCGAVIGRHEGAQFYTIGQRKGLGIGGHRESLFVLDTDVRRNIVYVGEGHTHKGLSRPCLFIPADSLHWIRPDLEMEAGELRRYRVRIRYRQPLQDATLLRREDGMYILFDMPQRGITPGQFAVWYAPDGEMTGSGVI